MVATGFAPSGQGVELVLRIVTPAESKDLVDAPEGQSHKAMGFEDARTTEACWQPVRPEVIKRRGRWASDCYRMCVWDGRDRTRDLASKGLGKDFGWVHPASAGRRVLQSSTRKYCGN